jgi:hypothetical protein
MLLGRSFNAARKELQCCSGVPDKSVSVFLTLSVSQAVVLSVTDEVGVSNVLEILLDSCRSKESVTRQVLLFSQSLV